MATAHDRGGGGCETYPDAWDGSVGERGVWGDGSGVRIVSPGNAWLMVREEAVAEVAEALGVLHGRRQMSAAWRWRLLVDAAACA